MREHIALLGFGTVGGAVYMEVIRRNGKIIEDQIDRKLRITYVLVRNTEKYRDSGISRSDVVVTDDFNCVIDAAPEIIIEVMGEFILRKNTFLKLSTIGSMLGCQ